MKILPPPDDDLEEDDDPDDMEGCEHCVDNPCSSDCDWNAFYDYGYSLGDSWCIGRICKCIVPAWAWEEEVEVLEQEIREG